jgi:hypothetical protein
LDITTRRRYTSEYQRSHWQRLQRRPSPVLRRNRHQLQLQRGRDQSKPKRRSHG